MLRSNTLIRSGLVAKFMGDNSIEIAKKQLPPDPSKILHYSTIGVAACLPATLLLPESGITLASDCMLSILIPTHIFLSLRVFINDYISVKQPFARKILYGGALCASGLVSLGMLVVSSKQGSFGTAIKQLWTK